MGHLKTTLIAMAVSAATIALVFRVKALRNGIAGVA
jgi:hypothetical protein